MVNATTALHLTNEELVNRFTWLDYLVFSAMLATSAGIGVFYGCFHKKRKGTEEFFMAGKSMNAFPVAMSLIASFISAIALIGIPTEIYQNGFQYWLLRSGCMLAAPTAAYVYLPVFWDLQVTSANEYLELRFDRSVRLLGSFLFILQTTVYMAIVVYAPSLALSQVTGIHVYVSVSSVCIVCVFYTALGGMKAVLWTDVLQIMVMIVSMSFIIIKGLVDLGGFQEVWSKATEGNRTTLADWSPDPRTRHSVWALVFGGYFLWLPQFCINQTQVQRYLCVKEKSMAVTAIWISGYGYIIAGWLCAFAGIIVYVKYADCDPVSSNRVSKPDQLLPLFVMDTLGLWAGVPGLFVAGVFAGALSTVSSGINALAMLVLEDFIKGKYTSAMSEDAETILSKLLSIAFGVLTFALVFLAEQLGQILIISYSLFGLIGGPTLGLFSLGMFFPNINSRGAFFGPLVGLAVVFWISIGKQLAVKSKQILSSTLPVNTCDYMNSTTFFHVNYTEEVSSLNYTNIFEESAVDSQIAGSFNRAGSGGWLLEIYKLSYLWYTAIGFFITVLTAFLISFATGRQNIKTLNPRLISPFIFKFKKWCPSIRMIGQEFVPEGKTRGNRHEKTTTASTDF